MSLGPVAVAVEGVLKTLVANVADGLLLGHVLELIVTPSVGTVVRLITAEHAYKDSTHFCDTQAICGVEKTGKRLFRTGFHFLS